MNGYEVYLNYLNIKSHFSTDSFDATKYKNVSAKPSSYRKRNDKNFFEYLAHRFKDEEIKPLFIANMIEGERYIIDLVDDLDTTLKTYRSWKKRMNRLSYLFENDCKNIKSFMDEKNIPFNNIFKPNKNKYPIIMRLMMEHHISLESYILLEKIFNLAKQYDKAYLKDHVYDEYSLRIRKYKCYFKSIETSKYKNILKQVLQDT